jgi:hypothetical protein
MAASCSWSRLAKQHTEGRPQLDKENSSATGARSSEEPRCDIVAARHADVAELVDARRSGRRARKGVEVRVLSSALLDRPRSPRRGSDVVSGSAFCGGDCSSLEPSMHGRDEVDGPQTCPLWSPRASICRACRHAVRRIQSTAPTGILILRVSASIMGLMLRLLIRGGPLKRFATGFPIVGVFLAAEVAAMAWTHFSKLNSAQRRRLIALLSQSRGRPRSLSHSEREDLSAIFAALEPRLFLGSATRRLSPVPVPKRLLYGPRGSAARTAAQRR